MMDIDFYFLSTAWFYNFMQYALRIYFKALKMIPNLNVALQIIGSHCSGISKKEYDDE